MGLKLITAPSVEPLTLADAKLHLRVDGTDEDALITSLIVAARQYAEHLTERSLITQTWELAIDAFPGAEIQLPRPKAIAITSVKYDDVSGAEQTLSAPNYTLDNYQEPAWLLPAFNTAWPATQGNANAVRVRYTAGYGAAAADVPEGIKRWMLLRIGSLYAMREEVVPGRALQPQFVDRLLDPYRIWSV